MAAAVPVLGCTQMLMCVCVHMHAVCVCWLGGGVGKGGTCVLVYLCMHECFTFAGFNIRA